MALIPMALQYCKRQLLREVAIFKLLADSSSKRPSVRGYFRILFLEGVFFLSFPLEVLW